MTSTSWSEVTDLLLTGTGDTLLMVALSTLIAALLGVPLGVWLYVSGPGGLSPQPLVHRVLGAIVDFGRSLPFIVLLVAILPLTRLIVGTGIGTQAAIVPLAVGAIPFLGRLVQNALREVQVTVVEAAITTGASRLRIIGSVLLRETAPALINAIGVTAVALIGYSAMAGVVSGGGLGEVAVRYGYQRYDNRVLFSAVVALGVLVLLIQLVFDLLARATDRRRQVTT